MEYAGWRAGLQAFSHHPRHRSRGSERVSGAGPHRPLTSSVWAASHQSHRGRVGISGRSFQFGCTPTRLPPPALCHVRVVYRHSGNGNRPSPVSRRDASTAIATTAMAAKRSPLLCMGSPARGSTAHHLTEAASTMSTSLGVHEIARQPAHHSMIPVAAGAIGFLTLIQSGERPRAIRPVPSLGDDALKAHAAGVREPGAHAWPRVGRQCAKKPDGRWTGPGLCQCMVR